MFSRLTFTLPLACAAAAFVSIAGFARAASPVGAGQPAKLSFNEDIQPILAENCFSCHGPDSSTRKGRLRLDHAEFATAVRGKHEPAIIPGKPEDSLLVERIVSTDDDERMPPLDSHKSLTPVEIALLKRWVAEGAEYQPHWSFVPPVRPALPVVRNRTAKVDNPIDRFIVARLEAEKLLPGQPEDPARLLRRVTFDLTGLPPTPGDLAAFVRDPSRAAYEREVDRLLASDACAEQFARQWLDAIRYADTHGIHIDNYRSIWPFRDWVVGAFRRNQPFDQFTIEQMAGDLLPNASLDQKVASGFNRCLSTTSEGGAIAAEYEAIYAKDRVETMSTVWLGLTTGCAACHDHKFDPISTKDFYSLTAFFRNNTMPAMDGNVSDTRPNLFVPAAGDRARSIALQGEIEAVKSGLKARADEAEADFTAWLETATALVPPPGDHVTALRVPLNEAGGPPVLPAGSRFGRTPVAEPAPGPYGPAPKINDWDLVLGPPVPLLRGGAESFALLVRVDGTPGGTLLSSIGEGEKSSGWEVFLENGKVGLHVADGTGRVQARGVAGAALAPGAWHQVLFCFDTASMRSRTIEVFVDGKSVANSTVSAHLPVDIISTAPLRLGSRTSANGAATAMLAGGGVWVQDVRRLQRGFVAADLKPWTDVVEMDAALKSPAAARTPAQRKMLKAHYLAVVDPASLTLAAKLDRLSADDEAMRSRGGVTLVMEEKKDAEPSAYVLTRGDYTQLGEKVSASTPAALPPLPADVPRNRLGLARWLVDARNPLTARVTVNRVWQGFFGVGLVESAGDFGVTGSRPSHPALLDWLAVEFRESGWNYRQLARLMVTSETYRQSAVVTPALLERDPANRLLARGPRYRLEAEQLRDQALAASGLLVARLGGPPVHPYQPEGVWEDVAMKESTTRFYRPDAGESLYRRSLYTLWKRTALAPAMDILNAPTREVSCVRRDRTNTPLQALVTLNDPLFVEASRHLAAQALHAASTFEARIDFVLLRLTGRRFTPPERAVLRSTLDDALALYRRDSAATRQLLAVGASPVDARVSAPELAAWTVVASEVMNLDESLTK